jgi:hypothetical protein
VKPKLPLPAELAERESVAGVASMAPAVTTARGELRRAAFRMRSVEPVMTELIRIRNARFQQCFF